MMEVSEGQFAGAWRRMHCPVSRCHGGMSLGFPPRCAAVSCCLFSERIGLPIKFIRIALILNGAAG